MQSGPQLRMDGGKYFSTVHGERPPGDPHQHVHYYQDGLPFSATRVLLADLIEDDDVLKARAAKKLSRQSKIKVVPVATVNEGGDNPQDIPDDDEEEDDDGDVDINLEMWLTGEAKYIFADIRTTIADRYKKRVISIADAVMFLTGEQKIITVDKLAPAFQAFMN